MSYRRLIYSVIAFLLFLVVASQNKLYAQLSYQDESLKVVLEDINKHTDYSVLYREANVTGIRISLAAEEKTLLKVLKERIGLHGLDFVYDAQNKQLVVFRPKKESAPKKVYLSGQVVDAVTGERLPYAAVTWRSDGSVKGTSANEAGFFTLNKTFSKSKVELKASFVGYNPQNLQIDFSDSSTIRDITFRLQPEFATAEEVVVTAVNDYGQSLLTRRTIDIGTGSILGETNTLKSLQKLPAVTHTAAMANGINLRGSPPDGFQVLLDGVTIYNQTHMFGLFDNFNADALKTSGFFYDITPANYQAPGGGTLSLINKTGSLNNYEFTAGISNSSIRATVEGPVVRGKSSFLLSGRVSYLNQIDWFQNAELIQWGLNVERRREIREEGLKQVQANIVRPESSDAQFADIHSKLYLEQPGGGRVIFSGYFGFDDIQQNSSRLFRTFNFSEERVTEFKLVETQNLWYNGVASVQYHKPLGPNLYQKTILGFSSFGTEFKKDDFTFTQIDESTGALESFTSSLRVENVLTELLAKHEYDFAIGNLFNNAGIAYRYLDEEYFEDSFDRPNFFTEETAHKIDAFIQSDAEWGEIADLRTGLRMHYFSNGNYLDWSPRVKLKLFPASLISFGGGYSINFQHSNRVSFSNVLTSDVWILVNESQPPSEVEQFTAGIYVDNNRRFAFQIEAYLKDFDQLRLHEIDTFSITNAFNASPWFANNTAEGKGVEFSLVNDFDWLEINQSFSVSRMEIENSNINNGEAFAADWDRTFQYSALLKLHFLKNFSSTSSFVYASGTPDKLSVFGSGDENRLGDYYRTDISLNYKKDFSDTVMGASFSIYNLFDRDNPWYREMTFVLDQSGPTSRFTTVPSDVYDLGIQPSFSVSISF